MSNETNNEIDVTKETNGNTPSKRYRGDGFSKIPFELIYEKDEFNPRMRLTGIPELAMDIWENTLREPIHVKEDGKGKYFVTSGHRRRAAYDHLINVEHKDIKEVMCKVYLKNHSEEDLLLDAVITNTGLPLLPLEQGKVIWQFMEHHDWTPSMIANKLNFHVSVPTMYQRKKMWENCPMAVKEQIKNGEMTVEEAQRLLKEKSTNSNDIDNKKRLKLELNVYVQNALDVIEQSLPEKIRDQYPEFFINVRKKFKLPKTKIDDKDKEIIEEYDDDVDEMSFADIDKDIDIDIDEDIDAATEEDI